MQNFIFSKLLVLSVVSVLCKGSTYCTDGELTQTQVEDEVLALVNGRRSTLAMGNQKNGPSGQNLPKAKDIMTVSWSCDLEKEAIGMKTGCTETTNKPADPTGKTVVYYSYYDYSYGISTVLSEIIAVIDNEALDVSDASAVKYSATTPHLENYANLMRAETTQIGCSLEKCTKEGTEYYALLCLTNQARLADGDTVYGVGTATCDSCPADAPCNTTTGLCLPSTATTTTTTTTTTSTTTTTTTTPYSGAIFPVAGAGEMTECGNSEVTSTLKTHFLDTHNQRRGQLASGSLTDAYGGITLPKAKDMYELIWNCDLEKQAIDYVRKCPTDTDTTLNDQSPGENFYRISSADLPYYRDGIKKAVTEWWKVYRWYNTPGTSATFLSSHANSPVSSYTRMGWGATRHMGCAIGNCTGEYVVVCRYLIRGNTVGSLQYTPGAKCSACPSGTTCTSLGLCN